ncbi:MAG: PH domain-containing protein [Patescibacteria group bacterium]|nr:PH domain-containing protein [Patescibacteria group bacterium]
MKPIIIHKHWFGLAVIEVLGAGAAALLLGGALYYKPVSLPEAYLLVVGSALATLTTLILIYVYNKNYIELSDEALRVAVWNTPFSSNVAECHYSEIEDADVVKGFFGSLFDFGTLAIQTAGTERNLVLRLVPHPERVRDEIMQRANKIHVLENTT